MADTIPDLFDTGKRTYYERIHRNLEAVYNMGHRSYHRNLLEYTAPQRARFTMGQINRGGSRNHRIINETVVEALAVFKAGLMATITNPSTDWIRLSIADKDLAEFGPVKDWLGKTTRDMNDVLLKSNFYKVMPSVYGDLGVIAVTAMLIEEDFDDVIRFTSLAPGTYKIGTNSKGRVDQLARDFQLTVRQMIELFALEEGADLIVENIDMSVFSEKVKNFIIKGEWETMVDIVHVLTPNPRFDPDKLDAKFKKYASVYYENGTTSLGGSTGATASSSDNTFLRESGVDMFNIGVPRWETTGEDAWGTSCPAMKVLGTNKALQKSEMRLAQADEHDINPAMAYPASLRKKIPSSLPGSKVYIPEGDQGKVVSRLFDHRFDKVSMEKRIERYQKTIDELFHKKAFQVVSSLTNPDITATAINALLQEARLIIGSGPVNVQKDLLELVVDLLFEFMNNQGRITAPPEELPEGTELKVEFLGVLAQAQKSIKLGGIRGFYTDVGEIASLSGDPTVWDKVNKNQMIDELAEGAGIDQRMVVSDEEVFAIQQDRAIAEQQAAAAEQAQQLAAAGKDLSETELGGDTALSAIGEQLEG